MTLSARVEYLFNLKRTAQGYNIGRILVWRDNILFSVLNVHIFEKRPNDPALTFSFVGRTKILYRFFQCSDSILNELIIFHDASLCLTPRSMRGFGMEAKPQWKRRRRACDGYVL